MGSNQPESLAQIGVLVEAATGTGTVVAPVEVHGSEPGSEECAGGVGKRTPESTTMAATPAIDTRWRIEVTARVLTLLRREPVPPAQVLAQCVLILDEATRSQRGEGEGEGGLAEEIRLAVEKTAIAPGRGAEAAAVAADGAGKENTQGLPVTSLTVPSMRRDEIRLDERSQRLVRWYEGLSQPNGRDPGAPSDVRQTQLASFQARMESYPPPEDLVRQGTTIGGTFSRTRPMHMQRYKRISVSEATHPEAWAALVDLVPELEGASEATIPNFPAPTEDPDDAVDIGRTADANLSDTSTRAKARKPLAPFTDDQRVDLRFSRRPGQKEQLRHLTLRPGVANLFREVDGERFYDWHAKSYREMAGRLYNEPVLPEAGDGPQAGAQKGPDKASVAERRLEAQRAEKAKRINVGGWKA